MSEGGISARTWAGLTAGAFLISIALALMVYYFTNDLANILWTILIVFGAYMAVSSVLRSGKEHGFGPSDSDVTVIAGVILLGLGIAGLSHSYTHSVLITAVIIILVVAFAGMAMVVKNRNA